jgi:hypothetical protein
MDKLYYIIDTTTNTILIENLTYDQGMAWLEQNAVASDHIMVSY